ncbi:heterokaryon incompatibility protein-domain-containing protein [Paraphoma chrysanthemicola]|nr:heterokaryon incompatibility protein-domain-containing protein [Paraphoma chrysanthemicola]
MPATTLNALPSRLLYIHPYLDRVALVKTTAQSQLYAVLSYCWGGTQDFRTLTSNLVRFERGFSVASLPQTLRDAVTVAKRLDIAYLWIDALCIVQDDPTELQAEIAKMPEIYRNGTVTILAGDTSDSGRGFLHRRRRRVHRYSITLQYPEGHKMKVLLDPKIEELDLNEGDIAFTSDSHNPDPVNSRAWIFQEILLSPRLLYFSPSQIIFHCPTSLLADGGLPEHAFKYRSVFQTLPAVPKLLANTNLATSDEWNRIVARYSELSMSFTSDKLPAISAIAQTYGTRFIGPSKDQPRYLAGLWRDAAFPLSLLWARSSDDIPAPRPPYRAPSWSWASIESPVWTPPYWPLIAGRQNCLVASVKECVVHYKSQVNPYGEVVGGFLRITAPVVEVVDWFIAESGCIYLQDLGDHFLYVQEGIADALDTSLTYPLTPKSGYKMLLLCIIRLPATEAEVESVERAMQDHGLAPMHSCFYLILLKAAGADSYTRVGLLRFDSNNPVESQKGARDTSVIETITIV